MLASYASMWDRGLKTIHATEHRTDLEKGARPVRFMPSHQDLVMCSLGKAKIGEQLEAGVIERTSSEWASPLVLVPKRMVLYLFELTIAKSTSLRARTRIFSRG